MGILDKIFDKDDDREKPKADFSSVQSGSSSTAPRAETSSGVPTSSTPADRMKTYTVKSGDTLSKIAQREYGDASQWRRIYEANRSEIKNPDLIYPGQSFTIPEA